MFMFMFVFVLVLVIVDSLSNDERTKGQGRSLGRESTGVPSTWVSIVVRRRTKRAHDIGLEGD